jgi:uncharacterized RDD family membrane protein YckC
MYAGFWKRFAAYLIDYILLTITIYLIAIVVGLFTGVSGAVAENTGSGIMGIITALSGLSIFLLFFIPWLYYALFESSKKQATLGKMVLGIKVVTYDGGRISFGRATGRYFAKILSSLILMIGYIMAGFTEKKQALHDMVAGTLVVNNS